MTLIDYQDLQNWDEWPNCVTCMEGLPEDKSVISFYRERNSHRGIGEFVETRKLVAKQVNQDFLREIGQLENLEYLAIKILTAEDLCLCLGFQT